MNFRPTRVRTFDCYKHPGRPVSFDMNGTGLEIEEIMEHWNEGYQDPSFFPDECYKVKVLQGDVYILKYSTMFKSWWVKEFEGLIV